MRFRISLHPEKTTFRLPYNYNYPLASAIYSFLDAGDPSFSDFLHDQGFSHAGKTFKLFTFSPLLGSRRKAVRDGLLMEGNIDWFISSPKEEFVTALAHGILQQGFLLLWGQRLLVEQVEVLKEPAFEHCMTFRTLSPIVVSTGEVDSGGGFHKKYLNPEQAEFSMVLEENLRRKYEACYEKEPSSQGITIKLLRKPQSKLIDYKGTRIRGWFSHFMVQGNDDLIKIGYEAGFGENKSSGFGMVEVTM